MSLISISEQKDEEDFLCDVPTINVTMYLTISLVKP